jgi:ABC-type sugar transport system substrate-binding protein
VQASEKKESTSEKIVVSLPDHENEYQVLQTKDAKAVADRLGLDVEVSYADGNAILQIQQLFKSIHAESRPRAIVMEPVSLQGLERVAQKAAASGIGWACLNCTVDFTEPLRERFPNLPVFTVGSDQVEIGRIQGGQMKRLLPAGGFALYIQGPLTATAARERFKGMQEVIAGSGIRTIILDSQWTEESAEAAVRSWLRLKTSESLSIEVVAAQDDSMARGARRAIEAVPAVARRWGKVAFLGIDGVPQVGQRLVDTGELTATVIMPSNTGPALEAMSRWFRSNVLPPASLILPVRSYPEDEELARRVRKP